MDNYTGKRLDGRYEIQEVIGVGGMAVVYKAYDNIDDRIVAVKILKDEFLANEEFRRRFKNESKAIAVLSHPNIVKVYDVSYGDKLQYIVMEYIEGITLKEYIEQQKTINWREAVHFMMQILRALQHAHDKGIVHRDVKPQNILLLQNGTIKVTDFGIARISRSETRTMTDSAIGSVHYISPEQARGDITDDKADIYSVGVVLYEMITGQLPFQSDNSVSVAIMQLQTEPQNPRKINDTIPVGLEQITMRAMQKNIKDRYQSAAEMLLDLEEFKRNPEIKFAYSSFVDNNPTKFITKGVPSAASVSSKSAEFVEGEEEEESGTKTIPVLIGVVAGLVAVLVLVFGGLGIYNRFFKNDKIEVPKFVDLNYKDDIENNSKYSDFEFDVTYSQSSTADEGIVISQSPNANSKIDKDDNVIKLTVASSSASGNNNSELVSVPDVYGITITLAEKELQRNNFVVEKIVQPDNNVEYGLVIRTDPAKGEKVQAGSKITVYYSGEKIVMPKLVGWSESEAKGLISDNELVLNPDIQYKNSTAKKGVVIEQYPAEGASIAKGALVNLVVSNGVPPTSSIKVTVTLPNKSSGSSIGKLSVFLDGSRYTSDKDVLLDGSGHTVEVSGTGSNQKLKILIDDILLYSCDLDFTKNPVVKSNEKYESSSDSTVPNVIGMTLDKAESTLNQAGFKTIAYSYQYTSDLSKVGLVYGQNPQYSIIRKYPLNTEITLTIYELLEDVTNSYNE